MSGSTDPKCAAAARKDMKAPADRLWFANAPETCPRHGSSLRMSFLTTNLMRAYSGH